MKRHAFPQLFQARAVLSIVAVLLPFAPLRADLIIKDGQKIAFMGDSITEVWAREPLFAEHPNFIGRGVSGQTAPQMLVRFRADVIDLKPAVVHIMGGTNDLAANDGPESDTEIEEALASMVELALAHHIKVVIASIPPAADFKWHPDSKPIPRLLRLNAWLKSYAARVGVGYVDYWPVLAAAVTGRL